MLIPMLICADAASEIEFCTAAFGARELSRRSGSGGTVVHAMLQIGEDLLMVHGVFPHLRSQAPEHDGSSPVVFYLYVEDADAVIHQALSAGAEVILPVADQAWGDRVGRVIDPEGHVWNIAAHMRGAAA